MNAKMLRKISKKSYTKAKKFKTLKAQAKAFSMESKRLEKRAKKGQKL